VALFDLFQRRINYLRISVIDRCNLRCLYCLPDQGVPLLARKEILRFEEIIRLAEFAVREGITKIRITGGEPLIRRGVVDLIDRLRRIPGLVDISLTTNGVLLKAFAKSLYAAGVRRINISLDTLDPFRFRKLTRRGDIADVLEGIAAAEAEGFDPIKLNMVVLKGVNDDEIPAFVRLAIEKPYHVRFIEFMPTGAGPYGWERFLPSDEIMRRVEAETKITPLAHRHYEGPAVRYRLEGGRGTLGLISPVSRHFCDACNRLRLTADGRLRSCLFSDREIHLKPALRNGGDDREMDRRLRVLFQDALDAKPSGHTLGPGHSIGLARFMAGIGG
jgi:cyclic pyranopterin phosphate synthase